MKFNFEEIACYVTMTGKEYKGEAAYGSDVLKSITAIDTKRHVSAMSSVVAFVYMYKGVFPIKISMQSIGTRGYLFTVSKITLAETSNLTVYNKEETS